MGNARNFKYRRFEKFKRVNMRDIVKSINVKKLFCIKIYCKLVPSLQGWFDVA